MFFLLNFCIGYYFWLTSFFIIHCIYSTISWIKLNSKAHFEIAFLTKENVIIDHIKTLFTPAKLLLKMF